MKYADWPEERKVRARAAHRRWKTRNQDKRAKYWKEYETARPLPEKLFRSMQGRKEPYDITAEDIVVTPTCPICGTTMRQSSVRGGDTQSPTLDKIVPAKGYTKGNVAVICKRCNSLKSNGSAEEHRKIAEYIERNT